MSEPIITIEGLSKRYVIDHGHGKGDGLRHVIEHAITSPVAWLRERRKALRGEHEEFWALRDVSFGVQPGEVVGIIGRNGAGKSTLLKILSRITEPTSGRVCVRGRVASLLEVGTGFHPELTGRENIFLNGAILGMSRAEIKSKFDEIVAFAGIEKFLDTPVKRYSSGMYVRLAFAVAAHLEPEILIVDEVLAVGDEEFQRKCMARMHDISRSDGRTILFVSHNMAAIQHLCSRCVLMDRGQVVQTGRTDEVVDRYLSKAVELTSVKLSARTDREGKGEGIITDIQFCDSEGAPVQEVRSGQTVIVKLSYAVKEGVTLSGCRITLALAKDFRPFFTISTDLVNKTALQLNGSGRVEFSVPQWPLSGGVYHVSAYLASDGTVTQDCVDDASRITVTDGDFYGTGRLYHEGWQGQTVLVPHSWQLVDEGALV